MSKELKVFTREEVAQHNKPDDLWIIVDAKVYDVTKFKNLHPGGISVFYAEDIAGQDATEAFYGLHRHEVLLKPQYQRLQIGVLKDEKSVIYSAIPGQLSSVPYAEPLGLTPGYHSPYYTDSHRNFQRAARKFVDEVVTPDALAREEDGKRPSISVIQQMAEVGILAMTMGPGKHLKGRTLLGGVIKPEEFDRFHELILAQELSRPNCRGYRDGQNSGATIGLPPIIHFGRPELRDRIVEEVLSGKKFLSLAISEAFAGSDVSGLRTTAKKTEDGKYWIINGTKKWITNGTFSDYFTVGCKTDKGLTVILVERGEGVETKSIKTSYSTAAGTAYITFDDVKVPVENTLGPEGGGVFVILSNFNHERWIMCCAGARNMRVIVEECLKWVNQRKAFGKPLHSQAVIRAKLADMIAKTESVQHWLENITYQMQYMDYKQQAQLLAGPIGLLKMFITRSAQDVARDAVQIFGGRGITKTGMGKHIEHYHRTVPFDAILGGAEDVLGDLGVRQAIKAMPKNAKL
ncbi:acyl-CoA dehydrogenase NM domain-like protein [Lentinus tigrinus ALCF2SS1-7]|uniref:Acyl-CoA dehydrogenase NM domain-like protein n=1 Tax=Lentinus tigrinus ALCF2SS1-6 TaxID=1328759 RepID=A0A5C2SBI7_9APHY|nr:acyl-CoA dehydrogenase NM domain-like protein [Lentinus tigrinus ALCF2SS1-6]RPD75191.1 acyl-CoA dehydrogenase NM domain-like protein [Lentinus tigrinus ALCF2SS1-7]